jgi:hypothetical protein
VNALARINAAIAEANKRTPGTIEVCKLCGIGYPFKCDEPMARCAVAKANNWT